MKANGPWQIAGVLSKEDGSSTEFWAIAEDNTDSSCEVSTEESSDCAHRLLSSVRGGVEKIYWGDSCREHDAMAG